MKKILSFILIFTLLMSSAVFGIVQKVDEGFSPLNLPTALGFGLNDLENLHTVLDDYYYTHKGDIETAITDLRTKNPELAEILDDNGVTVDNSKAVAQFFIDTMEDDNNIDDTIKELVTIKTYYQDIIDNLNSNYYENYDFKDTGDNEGTRAATYIYFLGQLLKDKNLMTYDQYDQSIEFTFASRLSNSTVVDTPITDETMTLDSMIKDALDPSNGESVDTLKQTLEDSLNDELSDFLNNTDTSVADIKEVADGFGVLRTIDTTPDDDNGGSSGGGGGGVYIPPSEDEDVEEQIKTSEELTEAITNLNESFDDEYTYIIMEDLARLVQGVNNIIDSKGYTEEVDQAINTIIDAMNKLLNRDDVDFAQAQKIIEDLIEQNISKAIEEGAYNKIELNVLRKKIRDLINKLISKSSKVSLIEAGIDQEQAYELIERVKSLSNSLVEKLTTAGLFGIEKQLEKNIRIINEEGDLEYTLGQALINKLKANDTGVEINENGLGIIISNGTLDKVNEEIKVKTTKLGNSFTTSLNARAGLQHKFLSTFDVNVNKATSNEDVGNFDLTFDLSGYNLDKDKVSVMFYNDEEDKFEVLNSWVYGDKIKADASKSGNYILSINSTTYEDSKNHWAESTINKMSARGIVEGRSDTEFDPQGNVTRAEFTTMLVNAFDIRSEPRDFFEDVNHEDWYYDSVNAAVINGLVKGLGDGIFGPNKKITRQDMVVLMARFYNYELGLELTSDSTFLKDINNASDYSLEAIMGASELELISGYEDNTFRPLNNATRAEALKTIENLLEFIR